MHVTGTLTFVETADGAEAHLSSKGSKWVAKYTTIENAITAALLANAVNRGDADAFMLATKERVPMKLKAGVDEFILVRCGFSAADARAAAKLQA